MKILIVYYSLSGITKKVVEIFKEKLEKNNSVEVFELQTEPKLSEKNIKSEFKIVSYPSIEKFDLIIVGGPVWAFGINYPVLTFLKGLKNIQEKNFILFVTMAFPFSWMGGNRAIKIMKKIIEEKNGKIKYTFCLNRMFKNILDESQKIDFDRILKT
ncbi:MAG: flavodoxin family protein [candidate division WOR-3 bacterium]